MRQYGLYSKIRERGHKWKFIYFDGDDLAACFQKTSRDVVYDDCRILLKSGWFETVAVSGRKKDGTYAARKMVALSHEDWMAKYPNKCNGAGVHPVVPQQLDRSLTSCPTATDQLAHGNQPVGTQHLTSCSPPTKTSLEPDSFKAGPFKAGLDGGFENFSSRPLLTRGAREGLENLTDTPKANGNALASTVGQVEEVSYVAGRRVMHFKNTGALPSGNASAPPVQKFNIKGVGLVEGISYEAAERKVKAQREAYLTKKGEL